MCVARDLVPQRLPGCAPFVGMDELRFGMFVSMRCVHLEKSGYWQPNPSHLPRSAALTKINVERIDGATVDVPVGA
ncbi:MAG: hypothetical protein K2X72_13185 [Reyranella sp.]|nr:hypothetical protein [Reyranella sp.]